MKFLLKHSFTASRACEFPESRASTLILCALNLSANQRMELKVTSLFEAISPLYILLTNPFKLLHSLVLLRLSKTKSIKLGVAGGMLMLDLLLSYMQGPTESVLSSFRVLKLQLFFLSVIRRLKKI